LIAVIDDLNAIDSYLVDPITPCEVVEFAMDNELIDIEEVNAIVNTKFEAEERNETLEADDSGFVALCELAAVLIKNRELFVHGNL
jgi:hypothetical protein